MSMSTINDKATVSLFVNGEQAEAQMDRLRKRATDLSTAIKNASDAGNLKEAKKLQRELDRVSKEMNKTESAAKGAGIVLNNLSNSSIHGLTNTLKFLQQQLKMTRPNSEAWHRYAEAIDEVKGRISELNEELDGGSSMWDRFKGWAEETWPAIDLISRGYDNAIGFLREYVNAYADMDQEMANVRKFTGMTAEEVNALNEEFKNIDTRSSREQLNALAQEAGRLGLSSQSDVLGFVRAADKINVALDDLGDGATLTLSKLTDMFGDKERFGVEQSLLKTGSVINELSQSSSAAAPFIAEFAERMSGVGVQAKMTVPQIMALGAVLDSTGQKVEASSTAISQVLVRMMQDPAKYATVAGIEVEKFSRLLKEDANEALLLFLDTLNKAGGLDVLAPMFKDMGENGSRAISALTTLAKNIDIVRQRQDEANIAFAEATSIDKEFEVQNNTVQASIDKAKKRFQELRVELGEKLSPLMKHITSASSALASAISIVVDFCIKYKTVIITLATAIGSYYAAVGLATIAQRAWTAAILLGRTAVVAYKYVVGLCQVGMIALTHGTRAAGTAFTFLNATMKANPFGLVISLVSTLVLLFSKLTSKTKDFNDKMKDVVRTALKYNEQMEKELTELDKLVGALEGATEGTKEYDKAKNDLLNKYGAYLAGLVSEEGKIIDLEAAYKRLSEAIRIANEERGIAEARKAVDDTYFEEMNNLQKQLSASLIAYGADQREASRLAMQVSTAMSSNRKLSDATIARLNELSKNIPNSEPDFLSQLALSQVGPLGSSAADIMHAYKSQSPMDIVNSMYSAKDIRNTALNEVDIIQRQQRPYGDVQDSMLESLISYAQEAANNGGGTVLKVADALAGTVEFVQVSAEEATKLLEQLQGEQAFRAGSSNTDKSDNTETDIDIDIDPDPDPDPNTTKKDRFATEKALREREEAEARISYAKGETTYSEHTKRMAEIAKDYYDSLLKRTDLSADERLKIEADYLESVNKETAAGNKVSLDEENERYNHLLDLIRTNQLKRLSQEWLSAEERKRVADGYAEVYELAELQHLQKILDIYEKGSDEWLAANKTYQDKQLAAKERHLKNMEALEKNYASIKDKYFGLNEDEKQAKLNEELDALKVVYERELLAAGNNAEEKLRIEEAYLQAQNLLRKKYGQESETETKNSMQRAMEASSEWLNGEGGKALTGTISTLTSGMSSIFSGLSSLVQAELEIQTASIEKKYDREVELAQGNSYKVAQLEKKKEKDVAKAKNEANRKMFAMQVIQAVAQTAQNALSAYGSAAAIPVVGYILAPIAAAMAVAAGLIQVAAIKKQQQASEAQGYSEGGFTKPGPVDEPAGVVHAGEWVASQKLLANPVARPMIDALDRAQRTNTIGSLRAEDVSRSITANNSLVRIAENNGSDLIVAAAVARSAQAVADLTQRLNEPFVTINTVTGDHGINAKQEEYARLLDNVTPKSKRNKK